MLKSPILKGKVWLIVNGNFKLIDDIDTDMIFHNQYLAITEIEQMGKYTFGNLESWKDFSHNANMGDLVIAGENFGCGSSRQQAVDCFISLKIQAILAKSFGAIYQRNAINSGFPIIKIKNIDLDKFKQQDRIEIDLENGQCSSKYLDIEPLAKVQYDIYQAGDLFSYSKYL